MIDSPGWCIMLIMMMTRRFSHPGTILSFSLAFVVGLAGCSSGDTDPGGDGDGDSMTGSGGLGSGGLGSGGLGSGGLGSGGLGSGGIGSGGDFATGGATDSGGSGSGGDTSTGGVDGDGGADSGGSSSGGEDGSGGDTGSGGAVNIPDRGPRVCACETPAGEYGTVDSTIIVESGEVYDGECQIFRANPNTLGDGGQGEDQKPVFRVEDGGTLRNVVLGASAADGIHTYGDVTLENVHVLDIGEDAITVKESGTVNIECGSAFEGSDKVFQVNAASTVHISHFTSRNAGKFMRQNGGTTFEVDVTIDHCDISNMDEAIFRTDSSSSHVTLTNSRYSDIGDALFIFGSSEVNGNSGQSSVDNNEEY